MKPDDNNYVLKNFFHLEKKNKKNLQSGTCSRMPMYLGSKMAKTNGKPFLCITK